MISNNINIRKLSEYCRTNRKRIELKVFYNRRTMQRVVSFAIKDETWVCQGKDITNTFVVLCHNGQGIVPANNIEDNEMKEKLYTFDDKDYLVMKNEPKDIEEWGYLVELTCLVFDNHNHCFIG